MLLVKRCPAGKMERQYLTLKHWSYYRSCLMFLSILFWAHQGNWFVNVAVCLLMILLSAKKPMVVSMRSTANGVIPMESSLILTLMIWLTFVLNIWQMKIGHPSKCEHIWKICCLNWITGDNQISKQYISICLYQHNGAIEPVHKRSALCLINSRPTVNKKTVVSAAVLSRQNRI